jgi:hypothetical protein
MAGVGSLIMPLPQLEKEEDSANQSVQLTLYPAAPDGRFGAQRS